MPRPRSVNDDEQEISSARFNLRTKPRIKRTIQRAAALEGVDDSAFMIAAAHRAALDTIASHERMALQPEDYEVFFNALDNPPPLTERLRAAFERYGKSAASE